MGTIPPPFPDGKGAGRVMGLVIFHSKATFVSGGFSFSPWGRRERGFPVLHYNPAMPIKNIIPGQTVTKEKLQRAKELRRDMTPAEKTAKRLAGTAREQVGSPFERPAKLP